MLIATIIRDEVFMLVVPFPENTEFFTLRGTALSALYLYMINIDRNMCFRIAISRWAVVWHFLLLSVRTLTVFRFRCCRNWLSSSRRQSSHWYACTTLSSSYLLMTEIHSVPSLAFVVLAVFRHGNLLGVLRIFWVLLSTVRLALAACLACYLCVTGLQAVALGALVVVTTLIWNLLISIWCFTVWNAVSATVFSILLWYRFIFVVVTILLFTSIFLIFTRVLDLFIFSFVQTVWGSGGWWESCCWWVRNTLAALLSHFLGMVGVLVMSLWASWTCEWNLLSLVLVNTSFRLAVIATRFTL
jgi:hypothetical protein